jgi:hypothetical protein
VAGGVAPVTQSPQVRHLARAQFVGHGAARAEHAPARRIGRTGQFARGQFLRRAGAAGRRQQRARVGVARLREQLVHRGLLHDPPQIHHQRALAQVPDHRQIVRDEHQGQPLLALQLGQQVEHLRLHRGVEGRHRLVADQDARPHDQRAGDAGALALPAGELVRIALPQPAAQAHALEHRRHARLAPGGVDLRAQRRQRLGHAFRQRHPRVQAGDRVLEDHLDVATQRPPAGVVEPGQVPALVDDAASRDGLQADEGARERGLAAARLADDAQGLAGQQVEVNIGHCAHPPGVRPRPRAGQRKIHLEAANREDRPGGGGGHAAPGRIEGAYCA